MNISLPEVPCSVWLTILECIEHNGFAVSEVKSPFTSMLPSFILQVRLRQFEASISSGAIWDSLPINEKNTDSIGGQGQKNIQFFKLGKQPS